MLQRLRHVLLRDNKSQNLSKFKLWCCGQNRQIWCPPIFPTLCHLHWNATVLYSCNSQITLTCLVSGWPSVDHSEVANADRHHGLYLVVPCLTDVNKKHCLVNTINFSSLIQFLPPNSIFCTLITDFAPLFISWANEHHKAALINSSSYPSTKIYL